MMNDIPDESVDLILCDLPFGTTSCAWDTIIPFEKLWEHYKRIIKQTSIYFFQIFFQIKKTPSV